MSLEHSLEKYTRAKQAIVDDIEDHKDVFARHERIVGQFIDAENELRDDAAAEGKGIENGMYKVTVIPQTQEVFDEDATLKALGMTKADAIEKGILKVNKRPPHISITSVAQPLGSQV